MTPVRPVDHPRQRHAERVRLFAAPLAFFLRLRFAEGSCLPVHTWLGVLVEARLVGLSLSFLAFLLEVGA